VFNHNLADACDWSAAANICAARNYWSQNRKATGEAVGDAHIDHPVAEHGAKAGYFLNMQHNPRVRLKLPDVVETSLASEYRSSASQRRRERQRWLASHLPSSARCTAGVPPWNPTYDSSNWVTNAKRVQSAVDGDIEKLPPS